MQNLDIYNYINGLDYGCNYMHIYSLVSGSDLEFYK